MKKRLGGLFLLAGLLALASTPVITHAQTAGTITGTVTDQSGGVVPSADVVITDSRTSVVARTLKTDGAGIYVAEALPVGIYRVEVGAPGFQKSVRPDIRLSVADRLDISFVLQVGERSETIEVKAATPVVESQSGEQSQLISARQIAELPILGRSFMLLQQIVPGASKTAGDEIGMGFYGLRGFAINGLNDHFTGYMLDGVWNTQQGNQTSTMTNPGPDTLAEFKVLTSNYSAKYGIAGGANLLAVTKSGASDFHVEAYEYLRNDKLDAANFFLNRGNLAKTPLRYNDFGYTIGGPFYIPGFYNTDKSKTFFFWSQEWRKRRAATTIVATTPTVAMRNGDFTGWGPLTNPTDPQTSLPMVDSNSTPCVGGAGMDQINPNCINSNMALLFEPDRLFPLPTNNQSFSNFVQGATTGEDWREDYIRVDHNFSSNVRTFVRFIHDAWKEQDPVTAWSGQAFPTVYNTFNVPSRNFIVKVTKVLTPTLLNEISFNYGSAYGSRTPPAMEIKGAIEKPAGYTAVNVFNENIHNLVPNLGFAGGWGGIDLLWGPWWAHQGMSQIVDDLTYYRGRHSLQFGAVYLQSRAPVQTQTSPSRHGSYFFDGGLSGHPIADAVLGLPASYGELQGYREPQDNFNQFEVYVQDDFKLSKRLTLNLGLRWFYIPHAYSDVKSMFYPSRYDPALAPTVNPDGTIVADSGDMLNGIAVAGQGVPRGLVPTHPAKFAPRFGFAWDPTGSGKTAIRGGYGIGYYRVEGNDVQRMAGNPPFARTATFFRPPFDDPAGGTAAPLTPLVLYGLDEIYEVPYAQNWSLGIQREITPTVGLSVAYVGSKGSHRDMVADINQPLPAMGYDFDPRIACTANTPFPCTERVSRDYVRPYQGWSSISNVIPVGNSAYHSLQVSLQKRLSQGLSFGTSYTWSKVIATCSGFSLDGCTQNYYNMSVERGLASFDRPHILVINYVYDLPFFKGMTGVGGALLGGWEATGLVTLQSGSAFTPGFSSATQGLARRPDAVAGASINDGPGTAEQWFNTSAFAAPPFGHFGNAGTGTIRGPGTNNWDLGLFKNFRMSERTNLQFRAELFNAFNHTNLDAIVTTFGSGAFGQAVSAHTARVVQMALRLSF